MKISIFILLFCSALLGVTPAQAAWWDVNSFPVPPNTKEINRESRSIMGQDFEYIYYESGLSVSEIKDFYQRRLNSQGWGANDPAASLKKAPDSNANAGFKQLMGNNLTYKKGDDFIMLGFVPQGAFRGQNTKYLLAKGKMVIKKEKDGLEDEAYLPRLNATPKKDVACVYPGAVLSDLNETPYFMQATYFAKGDVEEMAEFYKTNMASRYGWSLREETPIANQNMQADPDLVAKKCPTCPDTMKSMSADVYATTTTQLYANEAGDTCQVVFTKMETKEKMLNTFGGFTIIVVHYAKKNR